MSKYVVSDELYHHGVMGMKWGIRRYQPYGIGYDAEHKGKFVGKRKTTKTRSDRDPKAGRSSANARSGASLNARSVEKLKKRSSTNKDEVTIDVTGAKTKGEIHDRVQKSVNTPDYYGRNLDALNDVLTEQGVKKVNIKGADKTEGEAKDYAKKMQKLADDLQNDSKGTSEKAKIVSSGSVFEERNKKQDELYNQYTKEVSKFDDIKPKDDEWFDPETDKITKKAVNYLNKVDPIEKEYRKKETEIHKEYMDKYHESVKDFVTSKEVKPRMDKIVEAQKEIDNIASKTINDLDDTDPNYYDNFLAAEKEYESKTKKLMKTVRSEKDSIIDEYCTNDSEKEQMNMAIDSAFYYYDDWVKGLEHSDTKDKTRYAIANDELYHHGILGMRWGVRRYQSYEENPKLSDKKKAKIGKKIEKLESKKQTSYENKRVSLQRKKEQALKDNKAWREQAVQDLKDDRRIEEVRLKEDIKAEKANKEKLSEMYRYQKQELDDLKRGRYNYEMESEDINSLIDYYKVDMNQTIKDIDASNLKIKELKSEIKALDDKLIADIKKEDEYFNKRNDKLAKDYRDKIRDLDTKHETNNTRYDKKINKIKDRYSR